MRDIKKIAEQLRADASLDPYDERDVSSSWLQSRMREHAASLDALASAEPKPPSVSRDALEKAMDDQGVFSDGHIVYMLKVLRALGIEVTP